MALRLHITIPKTLDVAAPPKPLSPIKLVGTVLCFINVYIYQYSSNMLTGKSDSFC